jgi:hypothetical protein
MRESFRRLFLPHLQKIHRDHRHLRIEVDAGDGNGNREHGVGDEKCVTDREKADNT